MFRNGRLPSVVQGLDRSIRVAITGCVFCVCIDLSKKVDTVWTVYAPSATAENVRVVCSEWIRRSHPMRSATKN
jgi:hypothetical protein